jgi:hypothetical protein
LLMRGRDRCAGPRAERLSWPAHPGALAQLVERRHGMAKVRSSILLCSTPRRLFWSRRKHALVLSHPRVSVCGMSPSSLGERAEAAVLHALVQSGREVYLPFGGSSRCDLIMGDAAGLARVQCKNGRLLDDVIRFRTCSNTGNTPRDYVGEIDLFGVYCAELGAVYLVPIGVGGARACHLRLAPPRNGQHRGIVWADDYFLGAVHPPRPGVPNTSGSGAQGAAEDVRGSGDGQAGLREPEALVLSDGEPRTLDG